MIFSEILLPKEDEEVKGDFDNPADFEFAYEIGI